MDQSPNIKDREWSKFVDSPTRSGESAVEVVDALSTTAATGSLRVDKVSATLIYLGVAPYAALETEAKWQIKKIDLSSGVSIKNASADYDQIWNNRASLTYV